MNSSNDAPKQLSDHYASYYDKVLTAKEQTSNPSSPARSYKTCPPPPNTPALTEEFK